MKSFGKVNYKNLRIDILFKKEHKKIKHIGSLCFISILLEDFYFSRYQGTRIFVWREKFDSVKKKNKKEDK